MRGNRGRKAGWRKGRRIPSVGSAQKLLGTVSCHEQPLDTPWGGQSPAQPPASLQSCSGGGGMLVEVTGGAQVLFFVPGLAQARPQTPCVCVCAHHLCPAPAAALGGDRGFLLELWDPISSLGGSEGKGSCRSRLGSARGGSDLSTALVCGLWPIRFPALRGH